MNVEEKIKIIKRNLEEIITEEDLRKLLGGGEKLNHYIGFEISGKIHLGTGIVAMGKVKDFMDAGANVTVFLADWHTWINDKLGGDKKKIEEIAVKYFKEGIKASLKCLGGNPNKVNFLLGSKLYHNQDKYWETLIDVCKNVSLSRTLRSTTIMGRKEGEAMDLAKLIYPPMQVADIFFQQVNLAHAGMDQRKAHVIARDTANKLKVSPLKDKKGRVIKPVAVHHHLILGLDKPPVWPMPESKKNEIWSEAKMSKSKPSSCVFIHDKPEEIKRKIKEAFCPEGEVKFNPILDWVKYLVFREDKSSLTVTRPARFGGTVEYTSYPEVEKDFAAKKLHPMDLKNALAENLIDLLAPARKHFEKPAVKKALKEMEKLVVTR